MYKVDKYLNRSLHCYISDIFDSILYIMSIIASPNFVRE